jgi:hypothetical protein
MDQKNKSINIKMIKNGINIERNLKHEKPSGFTISAECKEIGFRNYQGVTNHME